MNTRALALAVAVTGLGLGACTGVNESAPVAISAVCALTDDCTFTAECAAQYIGGYVFDSSLADQFWLPVQVNNRLLNNADASAGRVNTNDAHITSFDVTYSGFALASASTTVNFRVQAAGAATVGMYVVPPQAAAVAAPAATHEVVALVKAKGYFEDGTSFETGEFPLAFTWCDGCLSTTFTCVAPDVPTLACGSVGVLPAKFSCVAP